MRGGRRPRGELPGVLEQVLQRDPEQLPVRRDRDAGPDLDLHRPVGLGLAHPLERAAPRAPLRSTSCSRISARVTRARYEHVVDELRHLLAGLAHALEVVPAGLVQPGRVALLHRPAEALDPAQRRPQVVGDGVAEALELAVLVLQVRAPAPPARRPARAPPARSPAAARPAGAAARSSWPARRTRPPSTARTPARSA